jgi:hypothetical protein
MIEDYSRSGCMESLELSPIRPRQAFTHVAGIPDNDQYTGRVLSMSLFRN